jgi:hypothetical protein
VVSGFCPSGANVEDVFGGRVARVIAKGSENFVTLTGDIMATYSRKVNIASLNLPVAELKSVIEALARLVGKDQVTTVIRVWYSGRTLTVSDAEFFERLTALPNRIYDFQIRVFDGDKDYSASRTIELDVTHAHDASLRIISDDDTWVDGAVDKAVTILRPHRNLSLPGQGFSIVGNLMIYFAVVGILIIAYVSVIDHTHPLPFATPWIVTLTLLDLLGMQMANGRLFPVGILVVRENRIFTFNNIVRALTPVSILYDVYLATRH